MGSFRVTAKGRTRLDRPSVTAARAPPRNRLLASLPAADLQRIEPHLTSVELRARQVIYEAEQPVRHVYFPDRGVISLVILMTNGSGVEATTVGLEGFVGLAGLFPRRVTHTRHIVQVSGRASRLALDQMHAQIAGSPPLKSLVERYLDAFTIQLLQSVACNAVHDVERRCARWLLMACDRAEADELNMTQELLAEMLGVRRPTVSGVMHGFQDRGLIRCQRGVITLLRRSGLQSLACECYGVIRRALDGVYGSFSVLIVTAG